MDPTPFLLFAAFIVGTSKGGLATVGSLAVPMVALIMNPVVAAATLLPVYIVTDWVSLWLYRRTFSARHIKILVPSMLFGLCVGTPMVLAPIHH